MAINLERMYRERAERLRAQMTAADVDALVLSGTGNVRYATGASSLVCDVSRAVVEPTIAVITAEGAHLFASYAEGLPTDFPAECVHAPLLVEFTEGASELAAFIADLGLASSRIGFDDLSASLLEHLPTWLPQAAIVDAASVVSPAKLVKTVDEIECIRHAQRTNELAMYRVLERLRPGIRQSDLTGVFLQAVNELGSATNSVDPVWQVTPPSIGDGPYAVHGDVAFPVASSDRVLREHDLLFVDTGIVHEGYCSDFGRTWIVGADTPTPRQQAQFARWCDVVARVLSITKPGTTGRQLRRAACQGEHDRKPWLDHYYLIHGIGTQGSEMPYIGTDLGEDHEETLVLEPGMVMVLEPVIWDDGWGGFRSEEIVVVTETGYELLSSFTYEPFHAGQVAW